MLAENLCEAHQTQLQKVTFPRWSWDRWAGQLRPGEGRDIACACVRLDASFSGRHACRTVFGKYGAVCGRVSGLATQ